MRLCTYWWYVDFNVVSTVGLIFELTLFPDARMKKGPVCIHHSCVRKNKFSMKLICLEVTQCLLFWEIVSLQVSNLQVVPDLATLDSKEIYWVWETTSYSPSVTCKVNFQLNCSLKLSLSLHQMTPLHAAAAKGGRLSILKYLIDKGADINSKDYNGVSKTHPTSNRECYSKHLFCCLREEVYQSATSYKILGMKSIQVIIVWDTLFFWYSICETILVKGYNICYWG